MSGYRGGCQPGMPSRSASTPACPSTCLHRANVLEYRDARDAWEAELEAAALGYAREIEDYRLEHPPVTFKGWLVGKAGERAASLERHAAAER